MRRFNYDDSEDKDEVDNMFKGYDDDDDDDDVPDISDEEMEAMIQHHKNQDAIALMQVDLVSSELDQRLLDLAMKQCQSQWFWNFKSWGTQMKEIAKTYMALDRILTNTKLKREKEG